MSNKITNRKASLRFARSSQTRADETVDVLIVGSGPIGATFARTLVDASVGVGATNRILMVDVGSQLTEKPGGNAKNIYIYNYDEDGLDALSQIVKGELTPISVAIQDPWPETLEPMSQPLIPPVSYQINKGNPEQNDWDNMPAAAASFNVGGQGAHWTCCTPRPVDSERIDFIAQAEMDSLLTRAETLCRTNQSSFTDSLRGQVIQETLSVLMDVDLPVGRGVQMLPLACERRSSTWVDWTGADTILGPLVQSGTPESNQFELRSETICRSLIIDTDGVSVIGANVENLISGETYVVFANTAVVVAAGAFSTPQILWKSNIRPTALGHYLNDQPMVFCQIVLSHEMQNKIGTLWNPPGLDIDPVPIPIDDQIPNVWIPFSEQHPFQCQIHRDAFPYSILPNNLGIDHRTIIDLRWFMRKEIRFEDHVTFSDTNVDLYGMPQVTFHYGLSEQDEVSIKAGMDDMIKAARSLGAFLPGSEPQILPRGSSLHYQGQYRMGATSGDSVCDETSNVWGYNGLFLGGNGVIPTSTACNPTLTSMALALKSCDHIIAEWLTP